MEQEISANFETKLFDICKYEDSELADMSFFLDEIKKTGIRPYTDPRLKPVLHRMSKYKCSPNVSLESLDLNFEQFKDVIQGNLPLIAKIFRNDLIIPEFDDFCETVTHLYIKQQSNFDGEPASYIPQLARVPKSKWGISICTVDGQRFSIGDVHDKFTIQSTSKPITYSLTLEELGTEEVHKYQGREPSGRMFNEIVLDHNNQPHNPMVNSGAIMSAAILLNLVKKELNIAKKFDFVLDFFKRMAGGEYLGFNNSIFLSERDSADRNFALAHFLKENDCFPSPSSDINISDLLDFYFQTCSLEMTAESESIIAATLANGGTCPITGEKVMNHDSVRNVLSLMLSCGLYNHSGDFAFEVGLPAKSGVSGTLMLVVPDVMGICLWSPPLDDCGNSVRGVKFCEELVKLYNFQQPKSLGYDCLNQIDPTKNRYQKVSEMIFNIHMAANAGDETALKTAYQQGTNMNIGDYNDRTPLHLAAAEGHKNCVKFLLKTCHVAFDAKDRWGQTALSEAIYFKHDGIAKLLRRHQHLEKHQNGQVLWKNIVNKKVIVTQRRSCPLIKFDKHYVKKNSFGFTSYMEGLTIGMQNKTILERKQTMKPVKEVDEEHDNEQFQAAFTIQKKYRDYLKRKNSAL